MPELRHFRQDRKRCGGHVGRVHLEVAEFRQREERGQPVGRELALVYHHPFNLWQLGDQSQVLVGGVVRLTSVQAGAQVDCRAAVPGFDRQTQQAHLIRLEFRQDGFAVGRLCRFVCSDGHGHEENCEDRQVAK